MPRIYNHFYSFNNDNGMVSVVDELQIFNGQNSDGYSSTITFDLSTNTAIAGTLTATIGTDFGFYLFDSRNSKKYYSHNYLDDDNFNHALILRYKGISFRNRYVGQCGCNCLF